MTESALMTREEFIDYCATLSDGRRLQPGHIENLPFDGFYPCVRVWSQDKQTFNDITIKVDKPIEHIVDAERVASLVCEDAIIARRNKRKQE